ncbi:PIKK family atypical protein kinase [Histomonas meleagridis]|uniref:PIKK family atypical protein kinase n=1 Tax=Histomonas meleagridis TaxID=135588 RepID=UPI00355AB808|nr:PIKK family atypical protein kinase [Histomonas meleagridis]KAH0796403.1 PIKK family atypical protein kinase [Histomonas meleagridis]
MSMIGYIIGLGDRHPSNIMIQRETGKVIHIDFGDSFEVAINRENYPEKVPFRLTRMIVNALDGPGYGLFRKACEDIMWVLRDNRGSLVALLEIFIHEPLEDVLYEEKYHQSPNYILERVSLKLMGKEIEDKKDMNVETQVDMLIKEAINPENYIRHYAGWCPYW